MPEAEPEPAEGVRWVYVPSSGNWVGIPTDPDMSIYSDEFEALLLKSKEH